MTTNNIVNLSSQGVPYYNGSGLFNVTPLTEHGIVLAASANQIAGLGVADDGFVAIGSTGANPVLAPFIGGTGINITLGSGSITIDQIGPVFAWTEVTTATQTVAVENGYVSNYTDLPTPLVFTLPASAALGDSFEVVLKAGAWQIAQNANQQIRVGSQSSTVGVTGFVQSSADGDCINLRCTTSGASTVWTADFLIGNPVVS